ncbi:hypothetical protein MD484_g8216, partial [Candolleomyces efflorescens]
MSTLNTTPVKSNNRGLTRPLNITKRSKKNQHVASPVACAKHTVARASSIRKQSTANIATAPLIIRKNKFRFDLDQSGCSASSSGSGFLPPSMPPLDEITAQLDTIKSRSTSLFLGETGPAYQYHAYKDKARAKNLRVLVLPVYLDFDIEFSTDEYCSGDMGEACSGSAPSRFHTGGNTASSSLKDVSNGVSFAYPQTPEGLKTPESGGLSVEAIERIRKWASGLECENFVETLERDVVSWFSASDGDHDDEIDEVLSEIDEEDDGDDFYSHYGDESEDDAMYYLSDEHAYQESLFSELSEGLI